MQYVVSVPESLCVLIGSEVDRRVHVTQTHPYFPLSDYRNDIIHPQGLMRGQTSETDFLCWALTLCEPLCEIEAAAGPRARLGGLGSVVTEAIESTGESIPDRESLAVVFYVAFCSAEGILSSMYSRAVRV